MTRKARDVSGIVLAGGLSTRIGQDKGRLELGGVPLAERALQRLASLFEEIIYVTNDPMTAPASDAVKVAGDEIPHLGPLGGILAGLKASRAPRAFVVGYDMPFVSPALVRLLIAADPGADIVVPVSAGRFEPLHAVYSRGCIPVIAERLDAGDRRIVSLYDRVKVTAVEEAQLREVDPDLRSFFNVNTLADLERAAEMAEDDSA